MPIQVHNVRESHQALLSEAVAAVEEQKESAAQDEKALESFRHHVGLVTSSMKRSNTKFGDVQQDDLQRVGYILCFFIILS